MSNNSFPGYGAMLNEFLKTFRKLPEEETSKLRSIRCPSCGFKLIEIVGHEHTIISVKCSRCKFSEAIDTALYRRMKRNRNEIVYRYTIR